MPIVGMARKLRQRNPRPLRYEGPYAFVPLTQGKEAKIDIADAVMISAMKWSYATSGYARAAYVDDDGKTVMYLMHRVITGASEGQYVDHVDGDKLNNTRGNIRICKQYQNMGNRGAQHNNTSGAKGVSFCKSTNRWRAIVTVNRVIHRLGRFDTKAEAIAAYDDAAIALLGEFARPNHRIHSHVG